MSWIRSSDGVVALVALVVLAVCAAGTAGAVSASADGVPNSTQVGEDVTATVTIEDPFTDAPDEWTLEAETELENVSWTVTEYDQGRQVQQDTDGGQEYSTDLSRSDGGDEVQVEITGTVPAIENYTYEPAEATQVVVVDRRTGGSTEEVGAWTTRPYTQGSQQARDAIDSAGAAIEAAGGDSEAEDLRQRAISSYDNGNFQNAVDLANDAESSAQQTQQRSQLLLYGGVAIVVLAIVGGGVWYWRNRGDDYDKLR